MPSPFLLFRKCCPVPIGAAATAASALQPLLFTGEQPLPASVKTKPPLFSFCAQMHPVILNRQKVNLFERVFLGRGSLWEFIQLSCLTTVLRSAYSTWNYDNLPLTHYACDKFTSDVIIQLLCASSTVRVVVTFDSVLILFRCHHCYFSSIDRGKM